jgi:hypothetical protein
LTTAKYGQLQPSTKTTVQVNNNNNDDDDDDDNNNNSNILVTSCRIAQSVTSDPCRCKKNEISI